MYIRAYVHVECASRSLEKHAMDVDNERLTSAKVRMFSCRRNQFSARMVSTWQAARITKDCDDGVCATKHLLYKGSCPKHEISRAHGCKHFSIRGPYEHDMLHRNFGKFSTQTRMEWTSFGLENFTHR